MFKYPGIIEESVHVFIVVELPVVDEQPDALLGVAEIKDVREEFLDEERGARDKQSQEDLSCSLMFNY